MEVNDFLKNEDIIEAQRVAEEETNLDGIYNEEEIPIEAPKLLSLSHDKLIEKAKDMKVRNQQLDLLLLKAESYSHFIMENQKRSQASNVVQESVGSLKRKSSAKGKSTNKSLKASYDDSPKSGDIHQSEFQPKSLVGGNLLPHQVDGLKWLLSLWENGLSGILADEMGLGKTIQVIALIAHLRDFRTPGPYLIVCPLATVSNWIREFSKWLPSCPTLLYHGSKDFRAQIRKSSMPTGLSQQKDLTFPVVITSFEICISDRPFLNQYSWQYLIVDEGHRIKNRNCRLVKELKSVTSTSRLLLTGTPIQNTLEELWSLLNFCSPSIFDNLEVFQSWFGFKNIGKDTQVDEILSTEQKDRVVSKLHEILRPFLLRRMKTDVLSTLQMPPKREIIVYCQMTSTQMAYYQAAQNKHLRSFLKRMNVPYSQEVSQINTQMNLRKVCNHPFLFGEPICEGESLLILNEEKDVGHDTKESIDINNVVSEKRRRTSPVSYCEPEEDDFQDDEDDEDDEDKHMDDDGDDNDDEKNDVVESPSTDLSPEDIHYVSDIVPSTIVGVSGKMIVLDRLLVILRKQGRKVLIFSQMTSMLDILEQYASYRGYPYTRLDGATKFEERQQGIDEFNQDSNIFLFFLSTRAGGLGINLTSADTVIIYDSDWNPHQDSQAQDRCHRVGQQQPVLIYRLITTESLELDMLSKQVSKKKLERLTIHGGDYRKAGQRTDGKHLTLAALRKLLQDDVGTLARRIESMEKIDVSDSKNQISTTLSEVDTDECFPIPREEWELITDRNSIFATFWKTKYGDKWKGPKDDNFPLEGKMYDFVNCESLGYATLQSVG